MNNDKKQSREGDDLASQFFVQAGERAYVSAQRDSAGAKWPKRFYELVTVGDAEGGYVVLLDGRPVNTPAKRRAVVPSKELAEALAEEWMGQGERIDPATMPLTKLVNSTIDGVAAQMAEVEAELINYAGSDLICYRAGEPEGLVAAQTAAWDPLLAFARDKLGARLTLAEGLMFAAQSESALAAMAAAVHDYLGDDVSSPFRLAALHVLTTLTGSLVLALATARGELNVDAAWAAAHVDEDFQMRAWGADAEALARREARFMEMRAAAFLSQSVAG